MDCVLDFQIIIYLHTYNCLSGQISRFEITKWITRYTEKAEQNALLCAFLLWRV